MKKITIMTVLLICAAMSAQDFQWAANGGGINEDKGLGIAVDGLGNTFVTGFFRSTAAFGDYTFASAGVEDIFLTKYDPAGNVLWAKRFGGPSNDIGNAVTVDADGNCYFTGSYKGPVAFGSFTLQPSSIQDYEVFVVKTDPSGNVIWAKKGGGIDWDEGRGISVSGNNLYVTGLFTAVAAFDSFTLTSSGGQDVFVSQYDLNGNLNWISAGGGAAGDIPFALTTDANGNAYITGHFQGGQSTFGTTSIVNAGNLYVDVFIIKINPAGTFSWARSGGTANNDDSGRSLTADLAGNVYVAGDIRDSGQFDNIPYTDAGFGDIFVAKYNTDGVIQYLSQAGNQSGDYAYGISTSGNALYLTGIFIGVIQLGNTTLVSSGLYDMYVAMLNASTGNVVAAVRAGGEGSDAGRAITASDNAVYITGDFEHDGSTFPPFTLDSNGVHDVLVGKIDFSSLGLSNVTDTKYLYISPNPGIEQVQLTLPDEMLNQTVSIKIYDGAGRFITTLLTENIQRPLINISILTPGIYFIVVSDDKNSIIKTLRLIKE
jgi:hypothetical protein